MSDTIEASTKDLIDPVVYYLDGPKENDVFCGRGKGLLNRPGNVRFHDTIRVFADRYREAKTKKGKSTVVSLVVGELRAGGSRFVKKEKLSGRWYDIGLVQAHDKTGHAIRDYIKSQSKLERKKMVRPDRTKKRAISKKTPLLKTRSLKSRRISDLLTQFSSAIEDMFLEEIGGQELADTVKSGLYPIVETSAVLKELKEAYNGFLSVDEAVSTNTCMDHHLTPVSSDPLPLDPSAVSEPATLNTFLADAGEFERLENPTIQESSSEWPLVPELCDISKSELLDTCSLLAQYEDLGDDSDGESVYPPDWLPY